MCARCRSCHRFTRPGVIPTSTPTWTGSWDHDRNRTSRLRQSRYRGSRTPRANLTPTLDRPGGHSAALGINPLRRADVPRTAREIINRIDEISFNSNFMAELAAIAFIEQVAKERVRQMFMHRINDKALDTLGASSKMNNKPTFLEYLRKIGWSAAEQWLKANLPFVGKRSTVDLSGLLPLQDGLFTDPIGIRNVFKPPLRLPVPQTEHSCPKHLCQGAASHTCTSSFVGLLLRLEGADFQSRTALDFDALLPEAILCGWSESSH